MLEYYILEKQNLILQIWLRMKPILEIQNISKKFKINHEHQPYLSIRDSVSSIFKSKKNTEDFWALSDISFNVGKGDTVGIVGKNGAGKSTLLKILSKITPPTSGKIIGRGRIASLLEVGTGFHPELTGRENIYMNGSILGMTRIEIIKNFDAIVDFAGVEKFLDTPLKHYSSGMQLRLAFAVAAFLENEILIIDEVLAVGDAEFQKKCMGKMEDVSNSGRTILFVSHNLGAISQLCKKSIHLNNGNLINIGTTSNIISNYLKSTNNQNSVFIGRSEDIKPVWFKKIETTNGNYLQKSTFNHDEPINIVFHFGINNSRIGYSVFFIILDKNKNTIFASESSTIQTNSFIATIQENFLVRGNYSIRAFIHKPNVAKIDVAEDVCPFTIIDVGSVLSIHGEYDYGNVFGKVTWK